MPDDDRDERPGCKEHDRGRLPRSIRTQSSYARKCQVRYERTVPRILLPSLKRAVRRNDGSGISNRVPHFRSDDICSQRWHTLPKRSWTSNRYDREEDRRKAERKMDFCQDASVTEDVTILVVKCDFERTSSSKEYRK